MYRPTVSKLMATAKNPDLGQRARRWVPWMLLYLLLDLIIF